ncbi:MAG: BatA domain-containing protein [Planctomycetota bacterium]
MSVLAFAFLNPALLWLLPLIAVPIVIHLLNRRRFQRVKWAAMDFLLAALKRNRRRLQMQQWLLLLLRTLAVLFLILLVSRPQFAGNVFGSSRTHHVICLDDSLSMAQRGGARDAFLDARDAVVALAGRLVESKPGDVFSLLTTDVPTKPLVAAQRVGTQLQARVREAVGGLTQAGDGTADLAGALAQAHKLIVDTPDCSQAEIVLFTDLRQADWLAADGKPRADLVTQLRALDKDKERVRVVAVGSRDAENLAVAAIRLQERVLVAGVPASFQIEVANRGLATSQPTELTVRIGHGDRATQRVLPVEAIGAGATSTITVQHTFHEAGEQGVVGELARDAFAPDDRRAMALRVRPAVRCLLVDGDPGHEASEAETFFLGIALDPDLEVVTGIDPVVMPDQGLDAEKLDDYDLIWLCNVPAPAPPVVEKLKQFVAQGGGLAVFTGNQVDPRRYDELFGTGPDGLLPLPLEDVEGDMASPRPMFLADEEHALVAREAESFKGLFAAVLVGRYHASREDPAVPVRPIVRVGDARGPALMVARESSEGRGRVVVVGTTADAFWTSLPLPTTELFPPLVNEIVVWTARAQNDVRRNLSSRDVYRRDIDAATYRADVVVRSVADSADQRTFTASAAADAGSQDHLTLTVPMAELHGFGLFEAGLARHVGAEEAELLSRNPPLREGELLRLTRVAFERSFPPDVVERVVVEDGEAKSTYLEASGSDLARSLAIALVVALLLESFLAWRSSR